MGLLMVISSFTGSSTGVMPVIVPQIDSAVIKQIENKKSVEEIMNDVNGVMSTEAYINQYFSDIPIMIRIAKCESTFRHLDPDGDIHRGKANNADVGVMQINEFYHLDQSIKENLNIYTLEGNVSYARELYEKKGTKPWIASKSCWGKYEAGSKILAVKILNNSDKL